MKHGKKRDQLQTTGHHIDDENYFSQRMESSESAHGTNLTKPRADIADGGRCAHQADRATALDNRYNEGWQGGKHHIKE